MKIEISAQARGARDGCEPPSAPLGQGPGHRLRRQTRDAVNIELDHKELYRT